jgi:hypothetical protein
MTASLSTIPDSQQIRPQIFKLAAQVFDAALDFPRGCIAVLYEEGEHPSSIKRDESLDDVVATHYRFVIGSSKLIDGPGPKLRRITASLFVKVRDLLQFA